jgi:hypothetical protein
MTIEWWLSWDGHSPIGPVETEAVLQRIESGSIPNDAFACAVGQAHWTRIAEIEVFGRVANRSNGTRSRDTTEPKRMDFDPRAHDSGEHTVVTSRARFDLGNAFDDPDEKTIVDRRPIGPSEPPPGP